MNIVAVQVAEQSQSLLESKGLSLNFHRNYHTIIFSYTFDKRHLGQEPDVIDSADFSPQHRLRLYWHNFPIEPHLLPSQREQDVQDILTPHCQRYSLVKKIRTVTTKVNSLKQGK